MEHSELMMRLDSGARMPSHSAEEIAYGSVFESEGRAAMEPERRLLAAVLEQALEDLAKPKLRVAAVKWLLGGRSGSLFDFVPVCGALGLDPEAVRARVLGKRRKK